MRPDAGAQYVLGGFYLRGERGKPKDLEQALRFFGLAAKQGHAEARDAIERLYRLDQTESEMMSDSHYATRSPHSWVIWVPCCEQG